MRTKFLLFIWLLGVQHANAQTTGAGPDFLYAQRLYLDAMYDVAARQFHEFAVRYPESPKASEALALAGDSYFRLMRFEDARKEYVHIMLQFPDAGNIDEVQLRIAQCFKEQQDYVRAANAFQQVKVLYPKSQYAEQAMIESTRMYILAGEFGHAIENFHNFFEDFSRSKSVLEMRLELAETYKSQGELQRALAEIDKLLSVTQKGRTHASALLLQSEIEERQGRLNESEKNLLFLVDTYSTDKEISKIARIRLGEMYYNRGLFIESNQQLSHIQGDSAATHLMAQNYFHTQQYQQALDKYLDVHDSLNIELIFSIGKTREKLKDFDGAIETYRTIADSCGAFCGRVYLALAQNYLNRDDQKNALKYLHDFSLKYQDSPCLQVVKFKIADIYENNASDYERAIRLYYDYIQQFPASQYADDAQFALARCYEIQQYTDQAINEYKKYLELYPGAPQYDQAEHRIDSIKKFSSPKDSGTVSKLAGLLSNVIDSPEQVFQLAMTYFNDLKDYESALNLLQNCLASSAPDLPVSDIIYYVGESYARLAENDSQNAAAYIDSAVVYFSKLRNNFAAGNLADDAAFRLIQIQRTKRTTGGQKDEISKAPLQAFVTDYPNSNYADEALYILADTYSRAVPLDSAAVIQLYGKLHAEFPASRFAGEALFQKANIYLSLEKIAVAQELLEQYIADFPAGRNVPEAHYQLALMDVGRKSYDTALIKFKKIISRYFYSSYADSARSKVGELFLETGSFKEGIRYFKSEKNDACRIDDIALSTSEDESLYRLAQYYYRENARQQSIALYQEHLKIYPNSTQAPKVLFQLGGILSQGNGPEKELSLSYFLRLLSDHPDHSHNQDAAVHIGDIYYDKEKYVEANAYYLKAIEMGGEEESILYPHMRSIMCLYLMDKVSEGDKATRQFNKMYNDIDEYLGQIELSKGDYFSKKKAFKEAEDVYKSARSRFKKIEYGARADLALGKMYLTLNRDEDALKILTEMPKKYAKYDVIPEVYLALGEFYYVKARQVESAMLAYRNAIEHPAINDTSLMQGTNSLIRCYIETHLWDRALTLSHDFIEKFPVSESTFEIRIQIGIIYYQLREYKRAIEYLTVLKHEAGREDEPRIQYWIADCYMEKGEYEKAIAEYLKVRYISKPTKLNWAVTAQFKAGLAYMKLGAMDNAKNLFKKIVIEQGVASPFGKGAQNKIDEIESM